MKDSLDRIDFATRRKGGVDSRIVIVCEYSKSGQIVARTANGVRQTYEYDRKGQLLAVKDDAGNAVERYAYDKAGNMLKKQILRAGNSGSSDDGRAHTPGAPQYHTTGPSRQGGLQDLPLRLSRQGSLRHRRRHDPHFHLPRRRPARLRDGRVGTPCRPRCHALV